MTVSEIVVQCRDLARSYGDVAAVAGVSATIDPQQVVVLVGPNGCGKTTLVEMLLGLRRRDSGTVEVLGADPLTDRARVARHLGVTLQGAALHNQVTAAEHLEFVAALYGVSRGRVDEIVERLGVGEYVKRRFGRLSGGQQRRILVAAALVGHPRLAVLDEPTSGVDMESRSQLWSALRTAMALDGTAVLATTHDLAEAQEYADRVLVMRRGRLLADDSPQRLVERCGLASVLTLRTAPERLSSFHDEAEGGLALQRVPGSYTVGFRSIEAASRSHRRWSAALGDANAVLRPPNLGDAYLVLSRCGAKERAGEPS